MGKLVRDRIPEFATDKEFRHLDNQEYRKALLDKIVEEALEVRESGGSIEELGDVLEVIEAIVADHGYDMNTVKTKQIQKRLDRGGFKDGIYLY